MDYSRFFSSDVPSFLRSPVREIFRKVDLAAIYSFAGGYPDAATFPVEDIKRLSASVLEKYGTRALQYGATQGVTELREAISQRYGVPLERIQITTSSQQGIDVCTRILADPGDVVLVNTPTYLGALQSFRAYRANVCPIEDYVAGKPVFSVPEELSVREVLEARGAIGGGRVIQEDTEVFENAALDGSPASAESKKSRIITGSQKFCTFSTPPQAVPPLPRRGRHVRGAP